MAGESAPDAGSVAPRRRRRVGRRLAVFGLSLALLLAALEVIARLNYPNPLLRERQLEGMYVNAEGGGIATRPRWRGELTVEGLTTSVRLNSLGMRSPEVGPRQPGEVRVLCLGDSMTFGYGASAEEAYPEVLRGVLAERLGRPVVTGNAGVPGYGTVEQARCLDRLMAPFDPDMVVVSIYLGNDFQDDQVLDSIVVDGLALTGVWARTVGASWRARLMLRSRLMMWLENTLMQAGSPLAIQPVLSRKEKEAAFGFPPERQQFAGLWMDIVNEATWRDRQGASIVRTVLDRVSDSLRDIRQRAQPAPVLVLILPSWYHVDEEERVRQLRRMDLEPEQFRRGLVQQRLREVCAALALPCEDLTGTLDRSPDPTVFYLPVNRHLNAAGHRMVAQRLASRIVELLQR